MLRLVVLSGKQIGQELKTNERVVLIGRGNDCQLIIRENAVSRAHGKLTVSRDRLIYTDTNSHNGSIVWSSTGDKRLLGPLLWEQEVSEGDIIQVGATRIRIAEYRPTLTFGDSVGDYTMVTSLREFQLNSHQSDAGVYEENLLSGFLKFPGFGLHDEQQVVESIATQVAQMLPDAHNVAVMTLDQAAIGNPKVTRADIAFLATRCRTHDNKGVDLSLSILSEVVAKKTAVCFAGGLALPDAESVNLAEMSSCICAPLLSEIGCSGFIQVYTRTTQPKTFGRRDLGLIAIVAGISSLLVQQARAAQREARLRSFASAGQVVAGMSHDAKNILVSLGAFSKAVERENPSLANSTKWQQVLDDIDFLRFLVRDTWSRLGAQQRNSSVTSTSLRDLCHSVLNRCKRYFLDDQQGDWFEVRNQIPPEFSLEVDAQLLSIVLFNCFKNSIDAYRFATSENKRKVAILRIQASLLQPEAQYFDLHIVDDAGGIPKHVRRSLGKELISTKGEMGSGLGTRIILEAVARLGGKVTVSSSCEDGDEIPAGTCITIRLPVKSTTAAEAEDPAPIEFVEDYSAYRSQILSR